MVLLWFKPWFNSDFSCEIKPGLARPGLNYGSNPGPSVFLPEGIYMHGARYYHVILKFLVQECLYLGF